MSDGGDLLRALLVDPQPWKQRGACAGLDAARFYPQRGEDVEPARQVCRGCQVRDECLDHALTRGEKHGVWGGRTELERRQLRRDRRGAA